MKSKLNNKSGSAMILAIILMFLVSIVIIMFSTQIVNGMRMSSKNYEDLKVKYVLEAGLENGIGLMDNAIEVGYKEWKNNDFNIKLENKQTINIVGSISDISDMTQITYNSININKVENSEDELKYTIEPTSASINLWYKMDGKNDNKGIYNIYKHTPESKIETDIIVNCTYKGKLYKMESKVEFEIEDLNTGELKHEIISWKQIK